MVQLHEQLGGTVDMTVDEQSADIDTAIVEQATAEAEVVSVVSATPEISPELQSRPNDQSPLAVLKSWLNAIKLGRTNV